MAEDAFDEDVAARCAFSPEPLDRASDRRTSDAWIAAQEADPAARSLALWRGDPLLIDDAPAWLPLAELAAYAEAPRVFLGLDDGAPRFAADLSAYGPRGEDGAPDPARAPFADRGGYPPLRAAAAQLSARELAVVGHARWLLDWHRRHRFCAKCGAASEIADGGAKRRCPTCGAEHFPRMDPVAIVLPLRGGSCLLGRSPRFPPKFYSALAGFVEAAETPEACARREVFEEAGVPLGAVRYCFSQPWPFPSSLMMGFLAEALDDALTLDPSEIVDAVWLTRDEARECLKGTGDVLLPPTFTIARQLIDLWLDGAEATD